MYYTASRVRFVDILRIQTVFDQACQNIPRQFGFQLSAILNSAD